MRPPDLAPELGPYQDEPPQLPTGSPGKVAELRLGFERRRGRTVLADLYRRAPLIVHRAIYWDEEMPDLPCVYICSNSAGVLQGDRYTIGIEVGPAARAHVTTQSATKIHEMDANHASQVQQIVLHDGAYLEYLPEPVIPFRRSRFLTHTRVTVAPSATLLYSEILTAGRKYYAGGERYEYELFSSTTRAERPAGEELFTEKFLIRPGDQPVRRAGVMGGFDVFGNVILLTPRPHADRVFEQTPAAVNPAAGWAAGASRLPNDAGLVYKVVGTETAQVRAKVREFWSVVRAEVAGARLPREFAWR